MNIDKAFYKRLLNIALPIALQSLISSSLTLLDNLMVSRLGELSLNAVGFATQTFSIQWMVIFGFCTGCSTFFTQFWGVRNVKNIRKVTGIALITCIAISLVFFICGICFPVQVIGLFTNSLEAAELGAQYLRIASINFILIALTQPFATTLRATQQTKIPMFISIASFVTDALFNYLLIFGKFGFPKLGVAGAAIATVMARALEFLLTIYVVFGKKNLISAPLKEFFDFDLSFVKRVYPNASVTTLNEALWIMAVAAQNAAYGHLGVTSYAAVQASITIMDLFQLAGFSLGDASLILIGEQIGKNELDEAKKISARLLKVAAVVGIVMGSLLIALHRPIISLFKLTTVGVGYANKLMIIRAIFLPLNLQAGILVAGTFRGGGDAKFAAITEISLMWLYSVPAAFIGCMLLKWPVYWVLVLVQCELIFKLIILYKRYFSGKWLKNMIKGL